MMLFKSFEPETKDALPLEQKSALANSPNSFLLCGVDGLTSLGFQNLTAYASWNYYRNIAPIYKGANMVATEFSEIDPVIYDTKEKTYIEEYDPAIKATELLKLLKQPNMIDTQGAFLYKIATSFIVTGDIFTVANGNIKKPPQELFYFGKQYFNIVANTRDGYAQSYELNKEYVSNQYTRDAVVFRFYNKEKTQELWQISQFNPQDNSSDLFGFSKLNPLYYQIEQYFRGAMHNYSVLKKGARPSGALIMKNISDDAKQNIKTQVQSFYQGSQNAGSVMALSIADGDGEIEFKELSISNKDMDFINLMQEAESTMMKILNIPFTFYDNSKSTQNNKNTDKFDIYDFTIIPMAKRIYKELNNFLMPRYDNSGRYELSFNQRTIPALQERYINTAVMRIETGLLDIKECRNELGGLEEYEEGTPLYIPKDGNRDMTIQEETEETETVEETDEVEVEETEENEKSFAEYKNLLTLQVYDNGDRVYTDEQIIEYAKKAGLLEKQ